MLISTMNDLPGYAIDEVFGEVFGLTVRGRSIGSQIGVTFKSPELGTPWTEICAYGTAVKARKA